MCVPLRALPAGKGPPSPVTSLLSNKGLDRRVLDSRVLPSFPLPTSCTAQQVPLFGSDRCVRRSLPGDRPVQPHSQGPLGPTLIPKGPSCPNIFPPDLSVQRSTPPPRGPARPAPVFGVRYPFRRVTQKEDSRPSPTPGSYSFQSTDESDAQFRLLKNDTQTNISGGRRNVHQASLTVQIATGPRSVCTNRIAKEDARLDNKLVSKGTRGGKGRFATLKFP